MISLHTAQVRPILFSTPIVRAILREIEAPGTGKTQTRRVTTRLRRFGAITEFGRSDTPGYDWHFRDRGMRWHDLRHADLLKYLPWHAGDVLWVRESSADVHPLAVQDGRFSIDGQAGIPGPPPVQYRRVFRADGDVRQVWHSTKGHPYRSLEGPEDEVSARHPAVCSEWVGRLEYQPWTPSIHMPRWASRLTLEVQEVRVERLQDISDVSAKAEGIEYREQMFGTWNADGTLRCGGSPGAREAFRCLWININGPDSWAANPWVCMLRFRPILVNIDTYLRERRDERAA